MNAFTEIALTVASLVICWLLALYVLACIGWVCQSVLRFMGLWP